MTAPFIALGALLVASSLGWDAGTYGADVPPPGAPPSSVHVASGPGEPGMGAETVSTVSEQEIIERYCVRCHSERRLQGNLSLEDFDVTAPHERAQVAEKLIVKLRTGMMPPPGASRPAGDTLSALVESIERRVDAAAAASPKPGSRTFQRLNRAEYSRSIEDLLGLSVDAGDYLPLDTKADNFDNIADVQLLSPTLLDAYLNAAAEISRLAVGDPNATYSERTYTVSGYVSQDERVEGAPFGTRGGISVVHNFPADGEYVFRVVPEHTTTGDGFFGQIARFEQLEISINGERAALLDIDQWMTVADPEGISMRTEPISVRAGPQRVTAAFVKKTEGPAEDLLSPHEWTLADRHTGMGGYGLTLLPHLRDLIVAGPREVTGVSDNPVRDRIFTCRPERGDEARACAEHILSRLATRAYRRPVTERDREGLLRFYEMGAEEGGFEVGVRTGLQAILASPHFIFRFEGPAGEVAPGEAYRISDEALASRLSFFLWAAPPDEELRRVAAEGRLSDDAELERQVRRMLADPRSEALATRFAAQWLRLPDLEKVHPDQFWFPDFDQQLADAMRRETELFFHSLVREDRPIFDLYEADFTFVNERLARHYGIDGVVGEHFQRVTYPDDQRRGILGHGSVLTLTSHAGRTSPVLRGKWVMEVLMGSPPPPPPPGVPPLDETADEVSDGRMLTTKDRMEIHRENPTCNACHRFIDPIGLALDNYGVTGKWRIKENGVELDTRGELYDGTPVDSPGALTDALLSRPVPLVRTFTNNLMAYALGRLVEYSDQPTVRAVAREAAADDYRMSAFILGLVKSDAFRMQGSGTLTEEAAND
ncbi:MAG: DUF1592 domain-containing protein [Gemmatimonadota bacterium]